MKKVLSALLVSSLLFAGSGVVVAEEPIVVQIDGVKQTYDQPPMMINNRTMVPLRGIFEALGATIAWDDATQSVTATKSKLVIKMQVGANTATVGKRTVKLDQPAVVVNNRTLVPVRFVSESLAARVEWDGAKNTVLIAHFPEVFDAAQKNDLATVKQLVEAGFAINTKDFHDNTLLHHAATYGSKELLEYVLSKNPELNGVDADGDTPLICAVVGNKYENVEALLATKQVNMNVRDKYGYTALRYAKKAGYTTIADLLAGSGATE
jgi:Copper amine oxidase N-terminal domain/Ankyrin repeats (3 copies)